MREGKERPGGRKTGVMVEDADVMSRKSSVSEESRSHDPRFSPSPENPLLIPRHSTETELGSERCRERRDMEPKCARNRVCGVSSREESRKLEMAGSSSMGTGRDGNRPRWGTESGLSSLFSSKSPAREGSTVDTSGVAKGSFTPFSPPSIFEMVSSKGTSAAPIFWRNRAESSRNRRHCQLSKSVHVKSGGWAFFKAAENGG